MSLKRIVIVCLLCIAALNARAVHRRALLIGINDYTASQIPQYTSTPQRDWRNLGGSVNDVTSMREMLLVLYGFQPNEIVTLSDQAATRAAILRAIETQLVAPAAKGDVVLFFYAGHGSQVRNSRSDEPDGLDESIVPADSRRGAKDIRDKELRRLFNRVLDRGARLTVMLDDCNSGSGARGLPAGTTVRGIRPDPRDVADGADYGPRPEERGALVLSASQDFENAGETRDADQKIRGVFTWAWMRAIRDASPGEPVYDTFLRAQARLRNETPYQEPVIAASLLARRTPFLGSDVAMERPRIAVRMLQDDRTAVLQGGWMNGLAVGSTLRDPNDPRTTLTVTKLEFGRSEARVEHGRVGPGALLEPAGWIAEPARPLRVWVPRVATSAIPIEGIAHLLVILAKRNHLRWINDPTVTTPQYVIRHAERGWQLLSPAVRQFGGGDAGAEAAIGAIPSGSSVFVQLPAPVTLRFGAVEITNDPTCADYVLAGRYVKGRLTYAWIRPGVMRADRHKSGLPVRSAWVSESPEQLHDAVLRLRKIAAWQQLESPAAGRWPYRLELQRVDGAVVGGATLAGKTRYRAVLRGTNLPPRLDGRFIYLFVIDSHGRSVLLFPRAASGSVENRFPIDVTSAPPPAIPIGTTFEVAPPYGVDTYFLLTTDEPLPNPSILEWDGVRRDGAQAHSALERLFLDTGSGTRSVLTPAKWSIERTTWESAPQKRRGGV